MRRIITEDDLTEELLDALKQIKARKDWGDSGWTSHNPPEDMTAADLVPELLDLGSRHNYDTIMHMSSDGVTPIGISAWQNYCPNESTINSGNIHMIGFNHNNITFMKDILDELHDRRQHGKVTWSVYKDAPVAKIYNRIIKQLGGKSDLEDNDYPDKQVIEYTVPRYTEGQQRPKISDANLKQVFYPRRLIDIAGGY